MEKFTVLIESRPFCAFDNTPMEQLEGSGMDLVDMRGSGVQDPEFVKALNQVDAILCGNDLVVNDAVLDMAPRVKVIAKMGAGLDTVDIAAATRHNAIVFHTPGTNNQAVADHTFGLILNADAIRADLQKNWAVVAEAIQTILRREGYPKPYEALKDLTRTHVDINRKTIAEFIESLDVSRTVKEELLKITPENYTGICDFV